jgi:hypothetical protein
MPMDGNACVGDFGGDAKQEILMYSASSANIYAVSSFDYTQPQPRPGFPLRQTKEYGNYSRYGSGDAIEAAAVPVRPGSAVERRPTPEFKIVKGGLRWNGIKQLPVTVTLYSAKGALMKQYIIDKASGELCAATLSAGVFLATWGKSRQVEKAPAIVRILF